MLDRLLSSSFYGPARGFSSGIPFVRYDVTPLPADAPPLPE